MMEIQKWTPEETNRLLEWILKNKNIQVGRRNGNPELLALLPGRSNNSIYDKWRAERIKMGLSPVIKKPSDGPATTAKTKRELTQASMQGGILRAMADAAEAFVINNSRVIRCSSCQQLEIENEELRTLLRKLKKVREAVEGFNL